MSSEIESRLEQLLAQLPEPDPAIGEPALARALAILPRPGQRARRPVHALALALAASLVLLGIAAGALAAAGALHVSFGQATRRQPSSNATLARQLTVPAGAQGIATIVDGRLWLTTSSGFQLEGLPVSAATLSPRALYVAAGIGNSLVAMAPDGRRAWTQGAGGNVAAIAWAPDGLQIAYVVNKAHRFRLYVIDGNGRRNQLIDTAVRPVTPSWRADSLALAYVSAGGQPVIYNFAHNSRRVIRSTKARRATQLAFAPQGATLAIATRHAFSLSDDVRTTNGFDFSPAPVVGLGWLGNQLAVAVNPAYAGKEQALIQLFQVAQAADAAGSLIPPGQIAAFDVYGDRVTAAVIMRGGVHVLTTTPRSTSAKLLLDTAQTVLQLAPHSRIDALIVR